MQWRFASSLPTTLHARLLRLWMITGMATALALSCIFIAGDLWHLRKERIEDFRNRFAVAARPEAYRVNHDAHAIEKYLKSLGEPTRLSQLCFYNAEHSLWAAWQSDAGLQTCPPLPSQAGNEARLFTVRLTGRIEEKGVYLGLLQADETVLTFSELFHHAAFILSILFSFALLTGVIAARIGARSIVGELNIIREQIECLMDAAHAGKCPVRMNAAAETRQLMQILGNLHGYLADTMIPKETVETLRHRHQEMFTLLTTTFRKRLKADSPLLQDLSDFDLLLQTEYNHALPQEKIFDLSVMLDSALSGARKLHPPHKHVHLSVALQPGTQRAWNGYSELLEPLLRHLLLIALQRTKEGLVLMRLEVKDAEGMQERPMLHIQLEDSGKSIQRWQLRQWLRQRSGMEIFSSGAHTASWPLVARLFYYLGGSADAESTPEGGLRLTGSLPLSPADVERPAHIAGTRSGGITHARSPLLLMVENDPESAYDMRELLAREGCTLLVVADHAQALEWAPTLPLSAIMLNASAPVPWQDAARRLHEQMHNGVILQRPLWLSTARVPGGGEPAHASHIDQVLLRPHTAERLHPLCGGLNLYDVGFYHVHDEQLRDDFPSSVITHLPQLQQEFHRQLEIMGAIVHDLTHGKTAANAAQQAHAVKSAALVLGYFRIAALMGEVEYAILKDGFARTPQNWPVIAHCLNRAVLPAQNPMARVAVSS